MVSRPAVLRTTKPKRQLNAYNFFFSKERERLLKVLPVREDLQNNKSKKGHGKIEFQELAQLVSANWKKAPQHYKDYCLALSREDKIRFDREMLEYKQTKAYLEQVGLEQKQQKQQKLEVEQKVVILEEDDFDSTPIPLYSNDDVDAEYVMAVPAFSDYHYCCIPSLHSSGAAQSVMKGTPVTETNMDFPQPQIPSTLMDISRLAQKLDRESQDILFRALLEYP